MDFMQCALMIRLKMPTKTKMKNHITRRPAAWQLDPQGITTDTVQYWKGGTMLTAQLTKLRAQELVADGNAFVISSQAIGALDKDGNFI